MKKVLIIEDDLAIARLLALSFKDDLNTEIHQANDYLKGLAMAFNEQYDLFLVDINLEGKSGLDLIRILGKQQAIDNKVIIISGNITKETQLEGYEIGVSNFVSKPVDISLLKAIMKKNLKLLNSDTASDLIYNGLSISPSGQHISYNLNNSNEVIQLSPTEYSLIFALIKAKGRIVPKEELATLGRDRSEEMSFKSIEMHISSLRKKLKKFEQFKIVSKWGVGYFLAFKQEELKDAS